jgi:hypothetical protein
VASKIYLETTIISYLAARPSKDLITAAHQQVTHDWWQNRRRDFDLFSSQLVIQESSAGDAAVAKTRLQLLSDISLVQVNVDCVSLARALVERGPIPEKASVDALHIAIASVHGMDYLLTWNCKHIANAEMQTAVNRICRSAGYEPPVICTPEELSGDWLMWNDEIVEETRQVRDRYAAKFDYDLDAIYCDLKKQEEQEPEKFISLPPKLPEIIPQTKAS